MTSNDLVHFINEERNAIVATVRKSGHPHTAWNPIAYVENKLYIYADPNSVCFRNLERDSRVAIAIASGDKAIFIEGKAVNVGKVNEMINTLLAKIRSVVKNWIPDHSYNYASLEDCQASIFEVAMNKILSYSG